MNAARARHERIRNALLSLSPDALAVASVCAVAVRARRMELFGDIIWDVWEPGQCTCQAPRHPAMDLDTAAVLIAAWRIAPEPKETDNSNDNDN